MRLRSLHPTPLIRFAFVLGLAQLASLTLPIALTTAFAQTETEGFGLNRFEPAERGSDWFANESLNLRGHLRPAVGLTLEWAHKPLVLYERDSGDELAVPVRNQLYGHVGASLTLLDRVRFGLNVPVLIMQTAGDDALVQGERIAGSESAALGDARLGADIRLLGEYGDVFSLAVGLQVHLPTGSREDFSGDGAARLTPRALVAGDIGPFAYAARLAFAFRAQDDTLGVVPLGSEVSFGAAAGIRLLDEKLLVGPELVGSTVVQNSDAFLKQETTPVEVLLGGHYRHRDLRFGLGVGPGVSPGIGAPAVRVLGRMEWHPAVEPPPVKPVEPEPPADTDGDGIIDIQDACPQTAGGPSQDPDKHGCPAVDTDGDGIVDDDDACVNIPGVATDDPETNGCPEDGDHDGIIDAQDACPMTPGVENDDPRKHGCPPPGDRDGDGITDDADACPAVAGPKNDDPQKHGCPVARVEADQIRIIERVEFETNKAEIRQVSLSVLEGVLTILEDHEDIKRVRVEGHTDDRGRAAYNKRLSQRRANAVKQWLVDHGIRPGRLKAVGLGQEQPIDSNETAEGRQENRRVEFHIIERADGQAGGEIDGQGSAGGEEK